MTIKRVKASELTEEELGDVVGGSVVLATIAGLIGVGILALGITMKTDGRW